jgi:subtilisin family serine protease
LVPVLGVSGLVTSGLLIQNGPFWWPNLLSGAGSTWWPDQTGPPEQRWYPVSGIYGFSQDRWYWAYVGYVTASPIQGDPLSNYRRDFVGTSFAAPQVAALAALLRNARPLASYTAVTNRIVWTRRLDIEQMMIDDGVPLAGLVDFNAALLNW